MVVNAELGKKYLYRPGGEEFIVTIRKATKMLQDLVPVTMEDGRSNTVPKSDLFEIEEAPEES